MKCTPGVIKSDSSTASATCAFCGGIYMIICQFMSGCIQCLK